MTIDADIAQVKNAYEQCQSHKTIFEYGPLRAYTNPDLMQQLWDKTIGPAVALVHASSCKKTDGVFVAEAPSPWHAYFYLRAQQQYVYRGGRPFGDLARQAGKVVGEHMFFRGQRCADWGFQSSLRRKDALAQALEQHAIAALAKYFRSKFVANDDIVNNTAVCFSQHYGIATDLADISCDPDIAVWFATHPLGKACPSGEGNAVVRAFTWAAQQRGSTTRILLPPPFIRNVYTQRGLFIDTSGTDGLLRGSLTLDVRFPRETSGGEFQVIRDSNALEVWPAPDASERELVLWARNVATSCSDDNARHKMKEDQEEGRLPKFWLARELYDFDKHITAWLSILDWVLPATCVTALPMSGATMRYEVFGAKVRALVHANPSFFKVLVTASEGSDFKDSKVLCQVLMTARKELAIPN